jgi:hypothetical protein
LAARPRYTLRDVKRTLRKHSGRLLAHRNVLYLSVGEKIRDKKGQKQLAIRVCVAAKKGDGYRFAVPRRIRGVMADGSPANFFIPTDVEKKPRILRALELRGGDPLAGAKLGSVGLVLSNTNGDRLILTNSHVTPGLDQSAQGQRVNDLRGGKIGETIRATALSSTPGRLHSVDAALIAPNVETDLLMIDGAPAPVVKFDTLAQGMSQQLFYLRQNGARLSFRFPNLVATPRQVDVDGRLVLFAHFFELSQVGGPPRPVAGDSGSVLVRDIGSGLVVHGLLFAGGGDTIGAVGMSDVFRALGGTVSGLAVDFPQG